MAIKENKRGRYTIMKKSRIIIASLLMVLFLSACGEGGSTDTNTVSVDKKGVVTGTIIEDFAESYYDADELKRMVDKEIEDYNAKNGADSVTVKTYEAGDGRVRLVMDYASYKDYAGLNEKEFFAGTVRQAYDAGYEFADVKSADGNSTLSKQEVLENGDYKLVILEEAQDVKVPGKILYMSDGVELKDNKTATVKEEGGLAYILYQ